MAEERRVVTILFADVAGSTALGESLDPEDARILLRRYYDLARETVADYGGIMEKFIGDAVVAVFGFPLTHDDDPQRALSAGLVLRDRVRADAQLNERLPIRIGINTGEVVATRESAAGDFPLTGDAVNVAARLQTAAAPWGIVCGERTLASSRGAFEFGPAIDVEARGKALPVRAFELVGRSARRQVASRTPLIGRAADLEQIELVGRRALEERRPFLISVIAPAGVGKTRLLEEFLDRLPSLEPRAQIAIAQCLPYGQRLTYWPLRGVLYRLIGVPDDAKAHTVRQSIAAWLQGSGLEALEREVELLAATVGAGESEVTDKSALLVAWRTFFEIAARRAPLVLVFEDLHWSSDSLLDLFEFVMQPRGELPLLMIALTRPELLDRRPAWGGGKRNYVSISLEPLTNPETARLVEQLLEGCSTELVSKVVQRAEGNPFFAGELIRAICERPDGDSLPDTVQATVLARLDLLEPRERRAVQLGSIFGRAFRLAGIQALEPQLGATGETVDRLLEKDLLRQSGGDLLTFRHILIREVAYHTLTRSERGRLHAAAGGWLESIAGEREDSLAELIAYHYREAAVIASSQRPNDPETERIRAKAVNWLSRAADVADASAASVEATRHLRSAIELAESTRLPDLYQRLGKIAEAAEVAIEAYRNALRLCREQGRPNREQLEILSAILMLSMRMQGAVANRMSEPQMEELRRDAKTIAAQVDDEKTLALYQAAEGFFPFWITPTGRVPTAEELTTATTSAERALETARRLGDVNLQSMALDALAGTEQMQNGWRRSRDYSGERLVFGDRLKLSERIDAHSMVAWSSALIGDLGEALRTSAEGLALVQPGQVPAWTLHLVSWRMYALTLVGQWDEAMAMAERAYQLWIESGRHAAGYALRGFMSAIDIGRARGDDRQLQLYASVYDEISGAFPEGGAFRRWAGYGGADLSVIEKAVVAYRYAQVTQVERLERGLSCLLDHDRLPDIVVAKRILEISPGEFPLVEAQAFRLIGRVNGDVESLTHALESLERAGAAPYAARVRCERALLTGDHDEMDAGLSVLERLGDQQQLGRFERLQVR